MIEIFAPAKLNLMLHITGQRPDGYHNLQTIFQLLDFGDVLTLEKANDITVQCPTLSIPQEDNLVYKAAYILKLYSGYAHGASIKISKNLPHGGGLGGGSSDAASTLIALNTLWQLNLSIDVLADLGRKLGADVPVFVRGHSAWAEGIGDILTPVKLPKRYFLVVHPNISVKTSEIFTHPQLTRDTSLTTIASALSETGSNDFEPLVRQLYPEVDSALKWLSEKSPSQLTGTGACIFTMCATRQEAEILAKQVPSKWTCFVAKGIDQSPLASLYQ